MSGIVGNNTNRGSGLVKAAAVGADSITGSEIADDAIDSEHYADGSIDNAHIADDAIDSEHYADGSIDNAHIADDAIDSEHYADGSIDNAHIADDAIDSEHYADGSIDEAHIADNAVSLAKMAGNTDGVIISFDASGDPVAVGPGSDGEVLTSTGAGSPPAFEAAGGAGLVSNIVQVNYDLSTSAGTLDITGAGFDPLHVIAMGGVTGTPPVYFGFMDDNGVERMIDNYHNVTAYAWQEATALCRIAVSSGNYQYCSAIYITDGIRLTWIKAGSPTGTVNMKFLFMK